MMHEKKGIGLIGEHTVNIVISVIVLLFLVLLAYGVYRLFTEKTEQQKIEEQFENLVFVIKQVHEKEETQTVLLFPPALWYVRGFPDYDFPDSVCRGAVGCICFCKDQSCTGLKKCDGFSYDVQLMEQMTLHYSAGVEDPGVPITFEGTKRFTQSAIEFEIAFEEAEKRIAIYEVKKNG